MRCGQACWTKIGRWLIHKSCNEHYINEHRSHASHDKRTTSTDSTATHLLATAAAAIASTPPMVNLAEYVGAPRTAACASCGGHSAVQMIHSMCACACACACWCAISPPVAGAAAQAAAASSSTAPKREVCDATRLRMQLIAFPAGSIPDSNARSPPSFRVCVCLPLLCSC